jgi:hypothetical protein
MKTKKYYIGFFRYDDAKLWHKTNLNLNKTELETYLNNLQYIDKQSIIVKEIELPE